MIWWTKWSGRSNEQRIPTVICTILALLLFRVHGPLVPSGAKNEEQSDGGRLLCLPCPPACFFHLTRADRQFYKFRHYLTRSLPPSRPRLRHHPLVVPRLDVLERAEKVFLRVLQRGRVRLLVRLQIRVDELDQAVEVFGRNLETRHVSFHDQNMVPPWRVQLTVSFC